MMQKFAKIFGHWSISYLFDLIKIFCILFPQFYFFGMEYNILIVGKTMNPDMLIFVGLVFCYFFILMAEFFTHRKYSPIITGAITSMRQQWRSYWGEFLGLWCSSLIQISWQIQNTSSISEMWPSCSCCPQCCLKMGIISARENSSKIFSISTCTASWAPSSTFLSSSASS